MKTKKEIENYKREYCDECGGKHTCVDLSGDLIDEQITICLNKNFGLKNEL